LWGRLDAAERVIAAVLPANEKLRINLTTQAHRAILVEELMFKDADAAKDLAMQRFVWQALDHWMTATSAINYSARLRACSKPLVVCRIP
jgi:hypothetical protein